MLRQHPFLAAALVTLGVIGACTNDFSQFDTVDDATTTSTGSAGGAGGQGGATSTSSTASGSTGEDCFDGADDDGDGAIDCADTECGGFACVARPEGWEGPGILYEGPPDLFPGCPAELPDEAYSGFLEAAQDDGACAACTCSAPTVTCTPANMNLYGNPNCGQNQGSAPQNVIGACFDVTLPGNVNAARAANPQITTSACVPAGGELEAGPPAAASVGRVCAAALGGGCTGDGEVCAPAEVDAPFVGKVCVWQSGAQGAQDCPAPFTEQHVYASELIDNRACTACSCGDVEATCTVTTIVYSDNACMNELAQIPNDNTCTVITGTQSVRVVRDVNGMCPPSGGELTGQVELGPEQTTVCCLP